jgi:SAM-dependent methyltransferase
MTTSSREQHWDTVYAGKAEDEVSWFEPSPRISIDLIGRTGAGSSAAILDVGGGVSHLPEALVQAGFTDITVLDVSAEAIDRLLARGLSNVKGIVADITSWRSERIYDVWHDRAVLHFLVDEGDRDAYRSALMAALKPGGQAIIATFAPTGPERCSGLPVRRYGPADLQVLLGPGFVQQESFEFDHGTPAGGIQRFQATRFLRKLDS